MRRSPQHTEDKKIEYFLRFGILILNKNLVIVPCICLYEYMNTHMNIHMCVPAFMCIHVYIMHMCLMFVYTCLYVHICAF